MADYSFLDRPLLETAWKRVEHDLRQRVFVRRPLLEAVIRAGLEEWLDHMLERFTGAYVLPLLPELVESPKGRDLVRPGVYLPLDTHLLYTAIVSAAYPDLYSYLQSPGRCPDYSYPLADPGGDQWVPRRSFVAWSEFTKASVDLAETATHVVVLDIAAYYENVNLQTLRGELDAAGVGSAVSQGLMDLLNAWTQPYSRGTGLPQGLTASDILAKLYLDPLDRAAHVEKWRYVRYVDDVRIFCDSRREGQKIILRAASLLRERGLQLQSSKSRVLECEAAVTEFDRGRAYIQKFLPEYRRDVAQRAQFIENYTGRPVWDLDQILREAGADDDPPVPVLKKAIDDLLDGAEKWDKTVFHFLVRRLGASGSDYRWRDIVSLLAPHPEETSEILAHLKAIDTTKSAEPELVAFLQSDSAVYDQQCWSVLSWLDSELRVVDEQVVDIARGLARDTGRPSYLRSVARTILAHHGKQADWENIRREYSQAHPEDQPELLCQLAKMPKAIRKQLYRAEEGRGLLHKLAARYANEVLGT